MIKGIIHNNRPLISLTVGWKLGVQELIALVDTGFTGELKISPEKAVELGLQTTHTEPVTLADENQIYMQASLALVAMEGVTNVVNVLISKGIPIIGVGLLRRYGYALNMDVKHNSLILQK